MALYLVKRLAAACLTLVVIITLAFFAVRLTGQSPYDDQDTDPSAAAALASRGGLDRPVFIQYISFLKNVLTKNDWGISAKIEPGVPVFNVVARRAVVSLELNALSLVISLPLGVLLGVLAATRMDKAVDTAIQAGVVLFVSVPSFVLASFIQYLLAYKLRIFPVLYEPSATGLTRLFSMTLPLAALSAGPVALTARYLRGELAEELRSDYVRTALAKGLTPTQTVTRHALGNTAIPMIGAITPVYANILGGSLAVERLFSIPGAGGLLIRAVAAGDYSLTVAALAFYAAFSMLVWLLADVAYVFADPRIRLGGKSHD